MGRTTVGVCLIKGREADATIAHLRDRSPEIRVQDHVTYIRVEAETDICIDLREISSYLGRDVSMPSFLVSVSAYFGEISVDGGVLTITAAKGDGVHGAEVG